jgi:hypothetical protein
MFTGAVSYDSFVPPLFAPLTEAMNMQEYRFTFPSKENRNNFLKLIAQNVGDYGYGLGLEFEGLEHSLDSPEAHGRIHRTIPGKEAYGAWKMSSRDVILDLALIAHVDPEFDRLETRINQVARDFHG